MHFNNYLKSLDDNYNIIKKLAKPRAELCGVKLEDLTDLPYITLKNTIPDLFDSQKFEEAFYLILKNYKKNITFKRVKRAKNNEKFLFMIWVKEQYKKINDLEGQYLVSQPDVKLIQAGIRELDVLGDRVMFNNLVRDFNGAYTHDELKNKPYNFIFELNLERTIMSRINKRLVEINKQK